jgi:hypothetical protein
MWGHPGRRCNHFQIPLSDLSSSITLQSSCALRTNRECVAVDFNTVCAESCRPWFRETRSRRRKKNEKQTKMFLVLYILYTVGHKTRVTRLVCHDRTTEGGPSCWRCPKLAILVVIASLLAVCVCESYHGTSLVHINS